MSSCPSAASARLAAQALEQSCQADQACLRAVEAAYRQRLRATREPTRMLRLLRARFGELALGLACVHNAAPRRADGVPVPPDALFVRPAGLELCWVRAARPDVVFLADWDELERCERAGVASQVDAASGASVPQVCEYAR
jgi:hypothetical protein